jgi:hypothetical protein
MAKTVTVTGKLQIPNEDGQAPAPFNLDLSFIYTQKVEVDLSYGAAIIDDPVSFGTMGVGGAKMILVKSPVGGCTVKFNGGTIAWPVPAGGYFLYANPSGGFVTAALVTVTGVASVQFLALA